MFHFFFSKKKFHCLSLWLFSSCDDSGHLQFLVVRWSAFVGKVTNPGHMANSGCRSKPPHSSLRHIEESAIPYRVF